METGKCITTEELIAERKALTKHELTQILDNLEKMLDQIQDDMTNLKAERDAWQETALGYRKDLLARIRDDAGGA